MKIEITNAKKIKIEKGDLLVFEVDAQLSPPKFNEWCKPFVKTIKTMYPDIDVLVLPKEVQLKKVCHKKKEEK